MKESEAFRLAAERMDRDGLDRAGICWAVRETVVEVSLLIYPPEVGAAYQRVRAYMRQGQRWAYPSGTQRDARILAALWLALEAEEEGR